MTESPAFFTTTSISTPFPVTALPAHQSPIPNGALSDTNVQEEEEYTIKCICGYTDDDGNTVYCPKCDTWQHIECYYPSKKVPEDHFCSECLPRDLDARRAAERQRRHREALDGGDRKIKRPSSKGQKKKHKDSITTAEQVNGWYLQERSTDPLINGRDQPPPPKKPKTAHRPSGSIVSLNGDSRKRALSNIQSYPSPSKSPQDLHRYPLIPIYTQEFLELYERDEGSINANGNEHTVKALNNISLWRADLSRIVNAEEQPTQDAPLIRSSRPIDESTFPKVALETMQKNEIEIDGHTPQWRFLKTQTPIKKDELVGEIRGEVGMLEEYCQQQSSSNRWQELAHPDPFVFFHPHMNIYIDSRKAGTQFRYLRRSCTPNVTLKTFLSEEGDWRHCFVAREDIPSGKELTAVWFLDPEMMSPDTRSEQEEPPFSRQCDWVSRVLANFGDCACNKGNACHLVRFDRRYPPRSSDLPDKNKGSRKRKTKSKNAISPLSTGQATNSRAGSEALKHEDDEHYDQNSTSASSDPKSRDMTPVNIAALDAPPVIDGQLTEREKKKIKNLEKLFEQQQSHQKKKKRTSGGSNLNTPHANSATHPGHFGSPLYGPRNGDGSPPPKEASILKFRPRAPPQTQGGPAYVSAATQTDPEDGDFEMPPPKRRKFMTPTQKLLRRVFADRARHDQQCKMRASPPGSAGATVGPPDVEMKDAAAGMSPISARSALLPSPGSSSDHNTASSTAQSPAYPLPSQAAHSHQQFKVPAAPKLQLSTLPPIPTFPTASTLSNSSTTPNVATPSTSQSPAALLPGPGFPGLGNMVSPSPVKKKMSLGDYMSRRNTNSGSTPAAEKSHAHATTMSDGGRKDSDASVEQVRPKPDDTVKREAVAQGGLHGSAIEDTLMKDETEEPEYRPAEPTEDVVTSKDGSTTVAASHEVSSLLASIHQMDRARRQSTGSS